MTVNYYNSYTFPGMPVTHASTATGIDANTKGLLTATKVNVLETSDYLITAYYYDAFGRIRETVSGNYKGGTDQVIKGT